MWAPEHCGVGGNEAGDEQAHDGANLACHGLEPYLL